jgi:adenine-specific DNA-methyltransferase
MSRVKKLGQYFTVSPMLQQAVFDLVQNKGVPLLEPSFGAGHLLLPFLATNPAYPMTCYELDTTVKPIFTHTSNQQLIYGDFTQQTLTTSFRTIIGNPPYVQRRGAVNLYLEFIDRCLPLLDGAGAEMIFIVPSDFIKLSRAAPLLQRMMATGSFTHFLFPNNEGLFSGAAIDVLVFRYEVGRGSAEGTLVNGEPKFCNLTNGIITFTDHPTTPTGTLLADLFTVHVGLVSGKDEVYKVPFGNIEVLADKDKRDRFILVTEFPTPDAQINAHLAANKTALLERRIKKFTEENWFEWGAPRNRQTMEAKKGQSCIYVRTLTRKSEVAFIGTVEPFGGALLCMIPKEPMAAERLTEITAHLNDPNTQKEYLYSGRFKMGQKQLCNVRL